MSASDPTVMRAVTPHVVYTNIPHQLMRPPSGGAPTLRPDARGRKHIANADARMRNGVRSAALQSL